MAIIMRLIHMSTDGESFPSLTLVLPTSKNVIPVFDLFIHVTTFTSRYHHQDRLTIHSWSKANNDQRVHDEPRE